MRYTIATGNAFEGIDLTGVFETVEEAVEYADRYFPWLEYNVCQLQDREYDYALTALVGRC